MKALQILASILLFSNGCKPIDGENIEERKNQKPVKVSKQNASNTTKKCRQGLAVVGGEEVENYQEFSFMAELFGCGGAFIDPSWILTAAHCFRGSKQESVQIRTGDTALEATATYDVKNIFQHEEYKKISDDQAWGVEPFDIALVELRTPVAEADMLLLPKKKSTANEKITVVGWGHTSPGGEGSPTLLRAELNVLDEKKCNTVANKFCTGVNDGSKGICQGDSGGPVLRLNSDGWYEALGINSTGCGDGLIGTHTEVYAYLDWIEEFTGISNDSQLSRSSTKSDNCNTQ